MYQSIRQILNPHSYNVESKSANFNGSFSVTFRSFYIRPKTHNHSLIKIISNILIILI